jgi:PAS domain S-box-containing protein
MAKSDKELGQADPSPSEAFAPRSNEPLLREAADSTPAPVWMTDQSGAVEFMNRAFCELTGIPRDKALGDAWLSVLHPDDLPAVREKRAAAWVAGHVPYTFEARFRRHDGAWRWFEVSSKPRIDGEGRFHGYVGLAVDRTEARAAQQALAESEARYRAAVESQAALLVRFRNDGTILFANSAFARIRNVTPEELVGTNMWDPIPESERPERRRLLATLTVDNPEFRVEMKIGGGGEDARWMLWTTRALVFDDQGRWTEAQSTGVDIHERKEADEHRKLLVDELNHRVKNTLAVVQGIAQQTFKNVDPEIRAAFENRLKALSNAHNLLTERRWGPASLHAIVDSVTHVCGAARGRIRANGPSVMVSPRQAVSIAIALQELCTNAMKYGSLSHERGVVDLNWNANHARLELQWRESGGPKVNAPKTRGYGSIMIERALAHDLQGTAKLDFQPTGLVCTIQAPLQA